MGRALEWNGATVAVCGFQQRAPSRAARNRDGHH